MRLLVLDQFSEPGGAQLNLLDLLPAVSQRRWKALVALAGNGPLFDEIRALGFDAEPLTCGPYRSGKKSMADLARFAAGLSRLAAEIRAYAGRLQADLIYVNGPRLLPAVAMARLRLPVLFHAHSYLAQGPSRWAAGIALQRLQAWAVANCRFVAAPWQRFVDPQRLRVIYNGVAGPSHALPGKTGPPVIGCIGRIAPEKGQLEFVEFARLVYRSLPDCRFAIVGEPLFGDQAGHHYAAEVRSRAKGLPIEFWGWASDIYTPMASLDLLVTPSASHEATTRVILEAWAAGVPVVAFASGGIPEIVANGQNGYLCYSVQEMARVATGLLTGEIPGFSEMAARARETWSNGFTLEHCRGRLLNLIEQVVAADRPSHRAA